jgi:hypothetical protein
LDDKAFGAEMDESIGYTGIRLYWILGGNLAEETTRGDRRGWNFTDKMVRRGDINF